MQKDAFLKKVRKWTLPAKAINHHVVRTASEVINVKYTNRKQARVLI